MMIGIMVASVFFVSASIWEGAAVAAPGNEFPDNGYFVATNSFPPNTVVYMTNLESGKTVQAVITAGLDSPVLLALLSRDAARAIDIPDQSVTRVRIIRPGEGVTPYVTGGVYREGSSIAGGPEESAAGSYSWYEAVPNTALNSPQPEAMESGALSSPGEPLAAPETLSRAQVPIPPQGYDLSLVPAEERPPAEITGSWLLPPEAEVAPLAVSPFAESSSGMEIDPTLVIPSWEDWKTTPTAMPSEPEGLAFSVPVISSLEKGKYYLQLRAFGRIELVEAELSRIGKNYPLVIQPSGDGSIYRILLGPVSLGESGALLQRFKGSGYEDAFIRQGMNY